MVVLNTSIRRTGLNLQAWVNCDLDALELALVMVTVVIDHIQPMLKMSRECSALFMCTVRDHY